MQDIAGIVSGIPAILNYGAIGLSFLLAYLSYKLVSIPMKNNLSVPMPTVVLVVFFMLLCLSFFVGGITVEYLKATLQQDGAAWGNLQGRGAEESFRNGGNAHRLEGAWQTLWWEELEDGSMRRFHYPDENGQMVEYPPETVNVKAEDSVLSGKTHYASGEGIYTWYEGRISVGDHVTLLYWTPEDSAGAKNVGVVFLGIDEVVGQPLQLKGTWTGRAREGQIKGGNTVWTLQ